MQKKRIAQALVVVAVGTALAAPGGVVWGQNRPVTNFQYDANGNLTTTTDAFGRATQQSYDALNRLTRVTQPKPSPSEPNPVTKFGVDGLDQLTSVTDARNLVTSYSVSGLGNLTQQVSPDTGTTLNTFDAAGNLKTSQDARGKITTYYYDGIHRLTRARYADGTNTYYYYDESPNSVGRLTRMVDPGTITTRWTYTPQGRVESKSQALSAGGATRTHITQYAYNPTTGQLTSMTYPSGRVIGFAYGAASKAIESVTVDGQPVASSVAYHPFGGIKSMRLHNGLTWASTLDQDGRITSYSLGGVAYSIAWDSANRITAITHATTAYWSRGYAYDGLDRIASFVSEPRDQIFSYDAVGNLLTKTDRVGTNDPVGYTFNIAPTSNRMTGIGSMGIGYGFDAAGNRTSDSTTTWVVNARGRVSQVRVISGATTYTYSYLINGQNLRVRKTGPSSVVPQGTQVFVYDEAGRLIGEYDNYGRARNEHVWLADRPVALIVYTYSGTSTTPLTTTVYSVEADHLGTPRLITDSAQAQRWSWHSAPYGDTQPNQNPASKGTLVYNLRFPGQYYDKEVNTFYNWHRDYESTTGRYIQSDPIGLAAGINTYVYVNGNPLAYFDPNGLQVGPPGTAESFIPIWGSGREAIDDFENGRYIWGTVNGALAVSDVFLLGTTAKAFCKGAWKTGSHAWKGVTRTWYGRTRELAKGTPVHHWAIQQSWMTRGSLLEAMGNQPWNLMPMESQAFHNAVHGWGPNAFNFGERLWYGSPTWAKVSGANFAGKGLNAGFDNDCRCEN